MNITSPIPTDGAHWILVYPDEDPPIYQLDMVKVLAYTNIFAQSSSRLHMEVYQVQLPGEAHRLLVTRARDGQTFYSMASYTEDGKRRDTRPEITGEEMTRYFSRIAAEEIL